MRTFVLLAVVTALLLAGALRTPSTELHLRVLRIGLFIGAGIFAALLVSAIIQALLGME